MPSAYTPSDTELFAFVLFTFLPNHTENVLFQIAAAYGEAAADRVRTLVAQR